MISKKITIFKHENLILNASFNNKYYLHVIRFKQYDVEFVNDEEVSCEL